MVALVTALLGFGDLPSSPALSPAICATWVPVVSTVYFAAESTAVGRELLPAVRVYGPSTQLDQLLTMTWIFCTSHLSNHLVPCSTLLFPHSID